MLQKLHNLFAAKPVEPEPANAKVTLGDVLRRDMFELWYQPKIDLRAKRLVGAEGLVRGRREDGSVIGPGAFLPGAPEADMLALTERVILTALRDFEDCAAQGATLKLSVNAPASAFVKLPLARMLREERPKTGHSSLARLRQLPFSELKIDRSYVTNCHIDKVNAGLCETIVELAKRFELKTVAEGIESAHESHKLQGIGCDIGQGFLFAKPMPKDTFVDLLGRRMVGAPKPPEKRATAATMLRGLF